MEEAHRPDAFRQPIQADWLPSQRVADEPAPTFPDDLPIGMHPAHGCGATVSWQLCRNGLGLRPWVITTRRWTLPQSFMRAALIVIMPPPLKALLLGDRRRRGRAGGVGLEDAMMLFMRGVLFGMAFGREFDADAQPPSPDCQRSQAQWSGGSPRNAMVTPDDARWSEAAEQADKHTAHRFTLLVRPGVNTQHITRE